MESFAHFRAEVWRVRWMALIPIVVMFARSWGWLPDESALTLVLYKPALACIGGVAAHITWSQLFYYIDGEALIRERRDLMTLGVFTMRGLYYAAFILGTTLGL